MSATAPTTVWTAEDELSAKRSRLGALTGDATLFLTSDSALSWLLDGARVGVSTAAPPVLCAAVTATTTTVYSSSNEVARLSEEELPPSVEVVPVPWELPLVDTVRHSLGTNVVDEGRIQPALRAARASLLPRELKRYRALCAETAAVLTDVAAELAPTLTERQAASRLAAGLVARGADPLVVLVAGESRLRFRHPLPTSAPLGRRAMLVVCARRHGMIANATRWVRFGDPTGAERGAEKAILGVEADIFAALRPGRGLADVFGTIVSSYPRHGFSAETWREHHQGGPAGYAGRDPRAVAGVPDVLTDHQAFAWNPSAPETKVEDTVLLTEHGVETLTVDQRWPTVQVDGRDRPGTLQL